MSAARALLVSAVVFLVGVLVPVVGHARTTATASSAAIGTATTTELHAGTTARDPVALNLDSPLAAKEGGLGLRPPAGRHTLGSVKQGTVAKNVNTVVEPGVDVAGDVAAINEGLAKRVGDTFEINGRVYGVHDGTLFPVSGPGFHQLNRGAFQALGVLNKFGDTPQAHAILGKMKNVGPDEVTAALRAWRAGQ